MLKSLSSPGCENPWGPSVILSLKLKHLRFMLELPAVCIWLLIDIHDHFLYLVQWPHGIFSYITLLKSSHAILIQHRDEKSFLGCSQALQSQGAEWEERVRWKRGEKEEEGTRRRGRFPIKADWQHRRRHRHPPVTNTRHLLSLPLSAFPSF